MSETLTIGRLAKLLDLPTSTIRYYERTGLLYPASRTDSNYRHYDRASVERLRFIRAAQASGFSLHDIAELVSLVDDEQEQCVEVQHLIEQRLNHVKSKLADLRRIQQVLSLALQACRRSGSSRACTVLNDLKRTSSHDANSSHHPTAQKSLKKSPRAPLDLTP